MYNNHITIKEISPDGETFSEPSKTVLGESYTIKELLQKHVRGQLPADQNRSAQYSEDPEDINQPDLNQLNQLDITDRREYLDHTRSRQKTLLDEIAERKAEAIAQSKKDESVAKVKTDQPQEAKNAGAPLPPKGE